MNADDTQLGGPCRGTVATVPTCGSSISKQLHFLALELRALIQRVHR